MKRLPSGLAPKGSSAEFTNTNIPDALLNEHALAPGHWGILHLFEGHAVFVNLQTREECELQAPDTMVIEPEVPHRLRLDGPMSCRIDFFRDTSDEMEQRTPGGYADEDVRASFERCEESGDFAQQFYDIFMNASPDIRPYFADTDFSKQYKLLRDSVYMLVSRDISDQELRNTLDRLGRAHGRDGLNIPPILYEVWLDSVCATGKIMDPRWTDHLERLWRVRLRPGIQVITAAY